MALFALVSCSKDDEAYPALITELVMSSSDSQGVFTSFTTDSGRTYEITNTVKGSSPNVRWRFVCGYVKNDETTARVYTFIRVPLLSDCTKVEGLAYDPTGFVSVWKSKGYINLHLMPKTQGGSQAWGFVRDSAIVNDAGGTNHYLSLCHRQLNDPLAYSVDFFTSLDLDSVSVQRHSEDTLFFRLKTFDGWHTWAFGAE